METANNRQALGVDMAEGPHPWWILAARNGAKTVEGGRIEFPGKAELVRYTYQLCEQARQPNDAAKVAVVKRLMMKQNRLASALCRISGIASARCAEDLEKIEEIANEALDELMRRGG